MELKLTEKAAGEVKRIIREKNLPDTAALRVAVAAGGCSGFEYRLEFEDEPRRSSRSRGRTARRPQCGRSQKRRDSWRHGNRLQRGPHESKLLWFNNPLAVRTCGCGNSFQA